MAWPTTGRWALVRDRNDNFYLIPADMIPDFNSCNEDYSPAHDDTYRAYMLGGDDQRLEDLTFTDPRFDI